MPIPNVPAEALRDAMGRFDRDLRGTADWAGWEQNRAHRYAIEQDVLTKALG
jgi:5-methylcytosine-specific restriction protein A